MNAFLSSRQRLTCMWVVGLLALLVGGAHAGLISAPTEIPGCRFWLDASDISTLWQDTGGTTAVTTSGDLVARWDDKSGYGYNVTQGTAGSRPTYAAGTLNALSTLYFSADYLSRANDIGISGNGDRTLITVWTDAVHTSENYQHTFHQGNSSTDQAYGHSAYRGSGTWAIGNHFWGSGFDTSASGTSSPTIAVSTWDGDGGAGAGQGRDQWWVDGADVGYYDRAALNTATNLLTIGSRLSPYAEGIQGNIAEVIEYDRVLTAEELNAVGWYLTQKWGLTTSYVAPSLGTLIWNAGSNGNWATPNWTGGPPAWPDATVDALIDTPYTVTVAAGDGDAAAVSLGLSNNGSVAIDPGRTLTLGGPLTAAAGSSVTLGAGARLVTKGASTGDLIATTGSATLDVSGSLAASHLTMAAGSTLTKDGTGLLSFDQSNGTNSLDDSNTVQVNAGELKMQALSNPLGGAELVLNGGTFTVIGAPAAPGDVFNSLRASRWTHNGDLNTLNMQGTYADPGTGTFTGSSALLSATPSQTATQTGALNYTETTISTFFGLSGDQNEYQAWWTGYYNAQVSGAHTFGIWRNDGGNDIDDDGSFYLDFNGNGIFEASEEILTGAQGTITLNLAAGVKYAVAIGFNENTGADRFSATFQEPSGGTYTTKTIIDPATQAGYWTTYAAGALAMDAIGMADTDVTVSANSTLNAATNGTATFGALAFTANSVLSTLGAYGGIYFNGTTLSGATAVGFDTECRTYPGSLNDGGVASTITKTGADNLVLDTAPTSLVAGTTFDVQAGGLLSVGLAPLGAAGVQLNGGSLLLTSTAGDLSLNNTVTVVADSQLLAGQFDAGVAGPVTVTINNPVLSSGILGLRATDGYVLSFPNALTGAGGIEVIEGETRVAKAMNVSSLILTGGTLSRTGNAALGERDITVSTELRLDGLDLDMTGATLAAGAGAHIAVLSGRTLTFDPAQAPLTVDHLTLQVGALSHMYLGGVQSITATGRYDFTDVTIPWSLPNDAASVYVGYDDTTDNPVILTGANQYTGETWIRRGVLRADDGVGLPTASRLVFDGNNRDQSSMLETSGTFARNIGTAAGEVYWNNSGGFAAVGGDLIVTLEGGAPLAWGSGTAGFAGRDSVQFGSRNADGMVELTNDIDLDGSTTRRFQIQDNRATKADFARISGNITGGNAGQYLRLNESSGSDFNWSLIEFTGQNTYVSRTRLDNATLYAEVSTDTEAKGLPYASMLSFEGNDSNAPNVFMSHGTLIREIGTGTDGNGQGMVRWDNAGGFAARGGAFVITLESGAVLDWAGGDTGFNGQVLQLGCHYADSLVEITNDINLAGTSTTDRHVRTFDNKDTDQDVGKLSGVISGPSRLVRNDHDDYAGTIWLDPSGGRSNTYTGDTRIDDGVLRALDGFGLSSASNLLFDADGTDRPSVLESSGTFTRAIGTGAGQVQWNNNAGGFAAWGGTLTVNLGGDAHAIRWDQNAASGGLNSRELQFGSPTADSMVEWVNSLDMYGDRRIRLFDNPFTDQDFARISGVIADGSGNRVLYIDDGRTAYGYGGTLELTGDNTYTRRTQIDGGVLRVIDGVGLPETSRVQFDADSVDRPAILESSGTFTRRIQAGDTPDPILGVAGIRWEGNGGGFAAFGAPLTVTLVRQDRAASPLAWNSNTQGFNSRVLMFGSPTANDQVELTNDVALYGNRTIQLFNNFYSTADRALLSGVLSNGDTTARELTVRGDPMLPGYNATDYSRGTLELANANTYTGDTHVYDGATLLVTGSINTGGGTARVHSTGIIGGTGTIGLLSIEGDGVISPGMSPGTLTVGSLSMLDGAIYDWELVPEGQDLVQVLGDLQFGSTWTLRLFTQDMAIDPATPYLLFTYEGDLTGLVESCVLDTTNVDLNLYSLWDESGAQIVHDPQTKSVYLYGLDAQLAGLIPEPATVLILGGGLLAVARRRRSARRR